MFTDSLLVWLFPNWHWLIILGMILSVSGTLYISSGFLDQEHEFLGALAQGFSFGIISGVVVGFGFGIAIILPYFPDILYLPSNPSIFFGEEIRLLSFIRFLLGLLTGLIFGFLFGFNFFGFNNRLKNKSKSVFYTYFIILNVFIVFGSLEILGISVVLPFADDPTTVSTLINELAVIFFLTVLFYSNLVFGDKTKRSLKKRMKGYSWYHFGFWHILANTFVLSLSLFFSWISGPDNSTQLGELLFCVGLFATIFSSKPSSFIRQAKARYRAIRDKKSSDYRISHCEPTINWYRFFRGFLIGLVDGSFLCGGLFRIAALFGGGFDLNLTSLEQGLIDGLMIGLLVGSIFGFGPLLTYKIENLSERSLGQIGLALAVLGILIAILPSLLN